LKPLFSAILIIGICTGSLLAQKVRHTRDNSDRIQNFASVVDVQADGKLLVTETITIFNGDGFVGRDENGAPVESHNNDIKRGIVRDFPTAYKDSAGYFTNAGFKLKAIFKNGIPEPYATEKVDNGIRIKIGTKDILLPPGTYEYKIEYETDGQLIFHADKDELYWNVNGNGWVFTIDTVSCQVHFPEAASIIEHACYTGVQGTTEHNCTAMVSGGSTISFKANKKLQPYEGMTIAAAVQKGIISPPGMIRNALSFLRSNYIIPMLCALIILLFGFYYITWYKKGRDPEEGVIYPQFSPPANLSPADCGYIMEQHYGPYLFTAALVDCAVKKKLGIEIAREGLIFKSNVYHFVKPQGTDIVASTANLYGFDVNRLYGESAKKGTYNSKLGGCNDALSLALNDRFLIRKGQQNKVYGLFALNKGYTQIGFAIIILAIFLSLQFIIQHPSLRLAVIAGAMLVILFIIHNIFFRIMSAYTRQGRDIADHLLGFKMYLETAEKNVYDKLTPPEKTLDLFEKYLPYAIALKVENEWAGKFEDIMQKALEQGYAPSYYGFASGGYHSFSMSDMSQGISSGLSNTISSASTPPSSSGGGSGGGGSSGGGGGGGGGGGW
jgi:uncharacterized membrane protein YgcG